MKKYIIVLLVVVLMLFCFTGCKQDLNEKPLVESEQRQEVPIISPTFDPGRVK